MDLRVGVAGAGAMGRNHARIYELLDGVRLEGVYDVDCDRAEAVAAEFGGKAVSSLEALSDCCEQLTTPDKQQEGWIAQTSQVQKA